MCTITENHPRWSLYAQLRKCGEITASGDGRHFGLNCTHCRTIFPWINIKEFIGHLHEWHASAFCTKEKQQQQQQMNMKKTKLCRASSPLQTNIVREDAVSFKEDPLETADEEATAKDKEEDEEDDGISDADLQQELFEGFCEEDDVNFNDAEEILKCTSESVNDEIASETYSKVGATFKTTIELMSNSSSSENEEDNLELDLQSLKNRQVLSYIIEIHQENPILWDNEHPFYEQRKKFEIYREMIREILERYRKTLTTKEIRATFAKLRKLYSDELLYSKEEQRSQVPTKLWCFEQLDFLRTRELADNATLVLPIDQLIPLAEIYKQHPVLWDLDCDGCHNRLLQKTDTQQMLQEVNAQMGLRMTLKQMRIRIVRMRRHIRLEKQKRLECEQNNEEFEPSHEELYEKLQYLEPFIGPFRCDECHEEIVPYHVFKAHVAAHEGRLPYTCSFCEKGFKLFCNFETHVRRHTGEKPFQCAYCDMSFAASGDLKIHTRLHTNEKPYICHVCGMAFATNNKLYKHKAVHEPERIRMRYECPHCPKTYTAKESLNVHINSHLKVRSAVCPECGKGFFGRKTLRQHMNLHDKVQRYECDLCKKKFSQKAGLCAHRRTHHKVLGNSEVL